MIVICPSCTGKFKLPDDKIKSEGTKVRCSKCGHTFKVYPEGAEPQEDLAPPPAPPSAPNMGGGSDFDGFSGFDSDFAVDDGGDEAPPPPPPRPAPKPAPTPAAEDGDFGNLDNEFGFGDDDAAAATPPPPRAAAPPPPPPRAPAPPPPPPPARPAPAKKGGDAKGGDDMEFTTSDGSGASDDDLFSGGDDFGNREMKDEGGPGLDVEDKPEKPAGREFDASDEEESRQSKSAAKPKAAPAPKPASKPAPKKPANKQARSKEKGGVPWILIPVVVLGVVIAGPIMWQKKHFPDKPITPGSFAESVMGILGNSDTAANEKLSVSIAGDTMLPILHKSGVTLYRVTGSVTNASGVPMSFLKTQVVGKLMAGGNLAGTAQAFPGNILGDSQLQSLPLEAIEEKMANKHGDNMVNLEVAPGASVPFMVVFTKVEGTPDSFELEIAQQSE